jgi:peptide/nickel transport system permease protein
MKTFLGSFLAHPLAVTGAAITLILVVAVFVVPFVSPYGATDMDFAALLAPPSLQHPFGTDSFGRDVLTRVLYGARVSLLVSFAGVGLALVVGTAAGLLAAYRGGLVEMALMRSSDLLFSFPSFVLALFLMVILGFGVVNIAVAIALVYAPMFARLSRNLGAVVLGEPWVQAAQLFGQSTASILWREVLPNIAAPLLVQATIGVAFGIVIEAGLSFLGLGVQAPAPSLGTIMADGREYFGPAPWVITMTGVTISIALLGLNLLGDGLRDLTDPKLRGRL